MPAGIDPAHGWVNRAFSRLECSTCRTRRLPARNSFADGYATLVFGRFLRVLALCQQSIAASLEPKLKLCGIRLLELLGDFQQPTQQHPAIGFPQFGQRGQ
jgi:hypothetical protein